MEWSGNQQISASRRSSCLPPFHPSFLLPLLSCASEAPLFTLNLPAATDTHSSSDGNGNGDGDGDGAFKVTTYYANLLPREDVAAAFCWPGARPRRPPALKDSRVLPLPVPKKGEERRRQKDGRGRGRWPRCTSDVGWARVGLGQVLAADERWRCRPPLPPQGWDSSLQ